MKMRLICLLLSVVMLLACLAGCAKKTDEEVKDDITEEASASTITLSMYLMSEAPVSAEQAAKIEAAVNKITKAKFKTQMKLTFLTADQYYTVLEQNIALQEQNIGNYDNVASSDETTEPETQWNEELQVVELKYPTIQPYQVDIFYFNGQEKFEDYFAKEYLTRLDEELSSASKSIKSYITPAYLTHMKSLADGTYAVPSNKPIGEYTYLLLNKEALAETQFAASDGFTSATCDNVQDLLDMIATNVEWSDKYVPLYSSEGVLDVDAISDFQYWGVDENGNLSNSFSVMGGAIDTSKKYGKEGALSPVGNIFADNSSFVNQLKTLKLYQKNGYYNDEAVKGGKDFAVGYVKGGADLVLEYGDKYEMVVIDAPTLTTEDLYKDMFGVSAYTSNVSRSMEILTYLYTNEDFRNLILYGIEGENYEVIKSELKDVNGEIYPLIRVLNDDYKMSADKTGNVLIATPLVGEQANRIEYYKQQNMDAIVAQNICFDLDYYEDIKVDMDKLLEVRKLSETIYKELLECDYDGLAELIAAKKKQVNDDKNVSFHTNIMNNNLDDEENEDPEKLTSLTFIYYTWLEELKIYIPPKEGE